MLQSGGSETTRPVVDEGVRRTPSEDRTESIRIEDESPKLQANCALDAAAGARAANPGDLLANGPTAPPPIFLSGLKT